VSKKDPVDYGGCGELVGTGGGRGSNLRAKPPRLGFGAPSRLGLGWNKAEGLCVSGPGEVAERA
jgi:hypothetical protein